MLPYAKILEYDIECGWTLSTTLQKGLSTKKKLYKRVFFFFLSIIIRSLLAKAIFFFK